MATNAKDSSSSWRKEKKVAPSSNARLPIHKQANPRPTTSDKAKSTTPPSSGKSVPNYLRPTFSSKSESLKLGKKNNIVNEDSAQKLLRRRSFDKPPSSFRVQESVLSPEPKERVASRDRPVPNRLSCLSASAPRTRTSTHYRPVLERNAKSLKPVKHQPQSPAASGSMRRTKSLSKNAHASKSPSSISSHQDTCQDLGVETKQETTEESLVHETEQTTNVERDEVEAETNDEDANVVEESQNKDAHEDEEVENSETSEVPSVTPQEVEKVEEAETEACGIEGDDHLEKEESAENQCLPEEGIVDDTRVESSEATEEEDNKERPDKMNRSEDDVVEETKNEESDELKLKEGEEDAVQSSVEQVSPQVGSSVEKRKQAVEGKKESPSAYNDVIEETKNKLLEKRKNKVRALVGAFETVIDYETAAGSNK